MTDQHDKRKKQEKKCTTYNKPFGISGGVGSRKVLREFESFAPVRPLVFPLFQLTKYSMNTHGILAGLFTLFIHLLDFTAIKLYIYSITIVSIKVIGQQPYFQQLELPVMDLKLG